MRRFRGYLVIHLWFNSWIVVFAGFEVISWEMHFVLSIQVMYYARKFLTSKGVPIDESGLLSYANLVIYDDSLMQYYASNYLNIFILLIRLFCY